MKGEGREEYKLIMDYNSASDSDYHDEEATEESSDSASSRSESSGQRTTVLSSSGSDSPGSEFITREKVKERRLDGLNDAVGDLLKSTQFQETLRDVAQHQQRVPLKVIQEGVELYLIELAKYN
jgi:hypothetical protein